MLKIRYEDMLQRIEEKSGLSQEDIESKIDGKMKQLSGLISKEGAAHIVANELGVALFEQASGRFKISDLKEGMRNVEILSKIMNIYEVREFTRDGRVGKVGNIFVGDESGRIRVVCWGSIADKIPNLSAGDVLSLKGGYVKLNNNNPELHLNDRSTIAINPPGEEINISADSIPISQRKGIGDLTMEDANVEILGNIVSVLDMRFYEICPSCGKRAKPDEGQFHCQTHGYVTPDYGYVLNAIIDDGSGNIRAVFFRNQVESLLEKSKEDILKYRDSPEIFTPVKNSLYGNMVKIDGRVVNNEMFDRLEFIASRINPRPKPEEEISKLQK